MNNEQQGDSTAANNALGATTHFANRSMSPLFERMYVICSFVTVWNCANTKPKHPHLETSARQCFNDTAETTPVCICCGNQPCSCVSLTRPKQTSITDLSACSGYPPIVIGYKSATLEVSWFLYFIADFVVVIVTRRS